MKDAILYIGAVSGAITSFFSLVLFVWKPLHRFVKSHKETDETQAQEIKTIKENLELHSAHMRENYMELLRLKIYSADLPLSERVNAGKKYLKLGGNGAAEIQHDNNVRQLREGEKH